MTDVTGAKVCESDHAPVHVELAPCRREAVARSGDRPCSRQCSGEIHPGHGHRFVDVQVGEEACARRGIGTGPTLPSPSGSSSRAARPTVRSSMLDERGRGAPLPFLSVAPSTSTATALHWRHILCLWLLPIDKSASHASRRLLSKSLKFLMYHSLYLLLHARTASLPQT